MQSTITKISTATVYTTLASTDLNRAETFYRDMLGFDVERSMSMPGNLMVRCGQNTGLTLYERPTEPQCDATMAAFIVEDIESAMSDLRSHGIMFEEYNLPYLQTTNGVATQGSSKACWFKDPDGNILSLVQM